MGRVQKSLHHMKEFVNRPSYHWVLGWVAFMDAFLLILPMDGFLITSMIVNGSRPIRKVIFAAIGSTLGSMVLVAMLQVWGVGIIQIFVSDFPSGEFWQQGIHWLERWGALAVFVTSVTPTPQHPTLIAAGLGSYSVWLVGVYFLVGRLIKYGLLGLLSVKAPHVVQNLWGVRREVRDAEKL